jgi:hypothetical protein
MVRQDKYTLVSLLRRSRRSIVEEVLSFEMGGGEQFAALAKALLRNVTLDLTEYGLALIRV